MEKKMTMADIAAISGVAKSTVSRYFNGGYVKEETRRRIQQVIADYDYEPNTFARLNAKSSNCIGVVVPTLNSKITGRVITSIDRCLRERGYTTIIKSSDHDIQLELQNLKRLDRLKVDGIILSSISMTPEHKAVIEEAGIPVVVLAQSYPAGISIVYDDYEAGRAMGEYVGKQEISSVGYVGISEKDQAVGIDRAAGIRDGLAAYGVDKIRTELGDYSFESGYQAARRLFSKGETPEAVICATDRMAYGVYKYLQEQGIKIPEEVSVAGFGGYDEGVLLSPPLTSIQFDSYLVGRLGAETLLKLLAGESVPKKQTVGFDFLERNSVRQNVQK